MTEVTVATWNIFLNEAFPQSDRIDDIADTLVRLDSRLNLSAIALQEVMALGDDHHGDVIAGKLDMDGLWAAHSRKKLGEHIGLIGRNLQVVGEKDLGHNKKAVKAYLGDAAIVSVHLRKQRGKQLPRGPEQIEQTEELLDWVSGDEKAIIKGDLNCLPFHKPRKMIEDAGFHSAFSDVSIRRRATVPTPEFLGALSEKDRRAVRLIGRWLNVDDIYLRNLIATDAGYEKGNTDHYLAWARVSGIQI